ncbi:MAG: hypothetical protein PHE21_02840 [Candidatus Dojkabacteria bacterium]|nr:hypothetical protein [Candidatus Dojkabacteria bacterium]
MKRFFIALFTLFFFFFLFSPVKASVGVGVGTGKIELDEVLKPGLNYDLPPLTVYNTGDKGSEYYVSIEFSTKEGKLESEEEWYTFTPSEFYLEPDGSQVVQIELNIPMRGSKPGDYFAFLTAQPKKDEQNDSASVGVAAACKLYFSIQAANIFQALYYRLSALFIQYKPWSIIVPIVLIIFLLWLLLRKKFKIVKQ